MFPGSWKDSMLKQPGLLPSKSVLSHHSRLLYLILWLK